MSEQQEHTADREAVSVACDADVINLRDIVIDSMMQWAETRNIDIYNNISQSQYNALLTDIYERCIKGINIRASDCTFDDYKTIGHLASIYIYACHLFSRRADLYGFSLFSGISYQTLYLWRDEKASHPGFEIAKNILQADKTSWTNRAYDSNNPVGWIFVLKNEYPDEYADEKRIVHTDENRLANADIVAKICG